LNSRVVLVTGGNGFLGKKIGLSLLEQGDTVIFVDSRVAEEEFLQGMTIRYGESFKFLQCDLEDEHERSRLKSYVMQSLGRLDCLINCAAFVGSSELDGWSVSFEQQSLQTWRRALEVNVTAPFHLAQLFYHDLKSSADGNIINIGSVYGEVAPDFEIYRDTDMTCPAAYAVSKAGLTQLTRWLSSRLAPKVRVNAIALGGIFRNQPPTFVKRYSSRVPLGRMATEDDVLGVVRLLSGTDAGYITGSVIPIDGGLTAL